MTPTDPTPSTLQADVTTRLEQASKAIYELEMQLRDQKGALEVLLNDAFHLGIEVERMGERTQWVLSRPDSPGPQHKPGRSGRFVRFGRRHGPERD